MLTNIVHMGQVAPFGCISAIAVFGALESVGDNFLIEDIRCEHGLNVFEHGAIVLDLLEGIQYIDAADVDITI